MWRYRAWMALSTFVLLMLTSTWAKAWPWGPDNFEDCMAAEMKGRPRDQLGMVDQACRKRFPAMQALTRLGSTGKLKCTDQAGKTFEFAVNAKSISGQLGEFAVLSRRVDAIEGHNATLKVKPHWKNGARLWINFEHGIASVADFDNEREQYGLSCYSI